LGPILFLLFFNDFKDCLSHTHVLQFKIHCNDALISCTTSYTYLGTVLDQCLLLNSDFDRKYKKASSKLGVLRQLMPLLTMEAASSIYSSIIVSALRYNCIVNLNLNETQNKKLQSLERRAKKILRTEETFSIKNQLNKQAVLLVRRCLEQNLCSNFNYYFSLGQHRQNTRNNNILVKLPKVKLEFAKNGFYFMGAKLYNSLPSEIRKNYIDFKKQIKLFYK